MSTFRKWAVAGALGALLAAAAAAPAAAAPRAPGAVPAFGHVFVIVGENTERSAVTSRSAPYLTNVVKPTSAWLTRYLALTHFSEANYIGMTSGQYTPCQQADGLPEECHQDVDNLFHQLDVAGVSWQSWMESMPEPCWLTDAGEAEGLNFYAPKHNPALFYDNIEGAGGVWSAENRSDECLSRVLPMGDTGPNDTNAFDAALASGDVGRFNLIVPNMCEDGHDICGSAPEGVTQFDDFLSREVPKILGSPAFGRDGVIVITFDEGTTWKNHSGGNILTAVISPLAKTGTFNGGYDHYSLLRTLESGFGIGTYLGGAATAAPIAEVWR